MTGTGADGVVVGEELPRAPERHRPVPAVDRRDELANAALQDEVTARLGGVPTFPCGRLATCSHVDQDEATCAHVLSELED